jgi:hypothetical protein
MAEPLTATARIGFVSRLAVALVAHPSLIPQLPQWRRELPDRLDFLGARQPWWNFPTRRFMATRVSPGLRVFEWGCGASTLWLMDRGCQVRAIESKQDWYDMVLPHLNDAVTLELVEPDGADYTAYVGAIDTEADNSLDLVIVDGYDRVRCLLAARAKVKPGGMLMLDDTEMKQFSSVGDELPGWQAHRMHGLKTGGGRLEESTVWIKPVQS